MKMRKQATAVSAPCKSVVGNQNDELYDMFLSRIQKRFIANTSNKEPLFQTTAKDKIWDTYLNSFPDPTERQYHNCHCCKNFMERYGHLAVVNEDGTLSSPIWNEADAPDMYLSTINALNKLISKSRIIGPFLSLEKSWGEHETGIWKHFAIANQRIYNQTLLTPSQAMAEKREDFKNVITALVEFKLPVIQQALNLLQSDSLYRSEKVLGQAQWLFDLHNARKQHKGIFGENLVWWAVANAPAGFCHPRASMIGTLLEDIASGMDFSEVSRRFKDKMHPLQYQRPQELPKSGNIEQAEKIVEKLGIRESLRRRFARIDEIVKIWEPAIITNTQKSGGVFSHLKPRNSEPDTFDMHTPPISITWEKFARTILPEAIGIEYLTPRHNTSYTALLTAVDPDSPPILQWDNEHQRNPVSWYVWHGGSSASQWGLSAGEYCKVSAITLKPSMWYGDNPQQGNGVIFILEGAKESRFNGLSIFPEILKSELHQIRATIEAYSKAGMLEGQDEMSACGIALFAGSEWTFFKVKTKLGIAIYKLDGWD